MVVGAGVGLVGCQPREAAAPAQRVLPQGPLTTQAGPAEPWGVVSLDPAGSPAWLGNGLVGFRVAPDGSAADPERFPSLRIDRVEPSGEEKILPWTEFRPFLEIVPRPTRLEGYRRRLDFRTGILTTEYAHGRVRVKIEQAVHPDLPRLTERWTFTGPSGASVDLDVPAPGKEPLGVWSRTDVSDPTQPGRILTEGGRVALTLGMEPTVVTRRTQWGFEGVKLPLPPGSADPDPFADGSSVWARRWETDIVIDGPVGDQQAVRSFLFYLRQATLPDGGRSVSPMGLSRTQYFGHIFWDADVWVFPALALLEPEAARGIADYRLRMAGAARENLRRALEDPKSAFLPGVLPAIEANRGRRGPDALMYPWESSVSGRETVPGPSRHQHHITGTVAFALDHAADLGLIPRAEADRVGRGAADFYLLRSERLPDGRRAIRQTMSPDEHFTGDNDLYTNALAQMLVDRHRPEAQARFVLPRDDRGFLSYEGDRFRGYKQAAAVLTIFPLQFPPAEAQARAMMDRFQGGVTPNGPAMTDSIHALIEARLGQPEAAYATWRRSWEEFTGHPLLLFSEKRRSDVTYFVTGAAGCLQTVLFGFGGLRLDDRPPTDPQVFRLPLRDGAWLSARPSLPPAWKSVQFTGVHVLGRRLNLKATRSGVVATGD